MSDEAYDAFIKRSVEVHKGTDTMRNTAQCSTARLNTCRSTVHSTHAQHARHAQHAQKHTAHTPNTPNTVNTVSGGIARPCAHRREEGHGVGDVLRGREAAEGRAERVGHLPTKSSQLGVRALNNNG